MLKPTLPNLDGVEENIATLYSKQDDGSFRLDVEGFASEADLQSAIKKHSIAEEHRKNAETKAAEFEKQLQDLKAESEKQTLEQQKKGGKFEEIKAGYDAKLKEIEEKYQAQIAQRDSDTLKSSRISKISELSNNFAIEGKGKALEPHIRDMVETEFVDGKVVHFLKQEEGSKIPLTDELFAQSLSKLDYLSDFIVGTKGSGGGASGSENGGGASKQKTIDLSKATAKELVASIEAKET